jgi:hypothetical protein
MTESAETKPQTIMLNREMILARKKLKTEVVNVPEWGGTVTVREMTGVERDEFETMIIAAGGVENPGAVRGLRAKTVALTAIDAEGNRLFTEDDAEALGQLSAAALNRVFEVSSRLSGLGADGIEGLAGN